MLSKIITFSLTIFLTGVMPAAKLLHAQGNSSEKLITLSEKDCNIRDVIDKITTQTDNVFFVYDDILVRNKKISCHFTSEPVREVISYITKESDLLFKCINQNTYVLYKNQKENFSQRFIGHSGIKGGPDRRNGIISPPERRISQLPNYPALAEQKNIEGSVKINLLINRSGKVEKVNLVKSSGYTILDRAALDYAKEILFEPAKKGDTKIATWYPMNFNYKLFQNGYTPNSYITDILDYYSEMDNDGKAENKDIQEKILETHIRYITKFSYEETNINYYLDKIIQPSVKNEWIEFWGNTSMDFLVFHDFMQRSSYEDLKNKTKPYLVKFLSREITNKNSYPDIQKLFKKKVYTFLENNYPELTHDVFREEVQKK